MRHLGGFDADRAAAGADVPDDARRGDVHLGQRDRADFGRREQAVLRLRLQERFVRIAEQPAANGFARPIRRVRIADQDHHVERVELLLGDFGQRAAGDALVARAEVFADVGGEVIDAAIEQRLGHIGRAAVWSVVNRPTFWAVRIFSSTESSGCFARSVRYASSHVSITRANASCMLETCGTTTNRSLPSLSHT